MRDDAPPLREGLQPLLRYALRHLYTRIRLVLAPAIILELLALRTSFGPVPTIGVPVAIHNWAHSRHSSQSHTLPIHAPHLYLGRNRQRSSALARFNPTRCTSRPRRRIRRRSSLLLLLPLTLLLLPNTYLPRTISPPIRMIHRENLQRRIQKLRQQPRAPRPRRSAPLNVLERSHRQLCKHIPLPLSFSRSFLHYSLRVRLRLSTVDLGA